MKELKQRKRTCSCCGAGFHDWKNQENEGTNCGKCTFGILRKEVKSYHESIELLLSRLNPVNQEKLRKMTFLHQRVVVEEAFKNNILSYEIKTNYEKSADRRL